MKLGFHFSIAGSPSNAPKAAKEMGCGAFQIFTTNPRSWMGKAVTKADAKKFADATGSDGLVPFAHVPYLCNPSSSEEDIRSKSAKMLSDNLANCDALGIGDIVMHVGSHMGKGVETGIANTVDMLGKVLEGTKGTRILLEDASGYNNSVGSRFEEIGDIIDGASSPRVGMCLDTCHAFAAGYDMRTDEAVDSLLEEIDDNVGKDRVGLVHLNDSKYPLGSHLDRHWHIGKGHIGREGFVSLFSNRFFREKCMIMETPINDEGDMAYNLKAATGFFEEATAKIAED